MEQQTKVKERGKWLNRVLHDYLRAIQAGQTPDREMLIKRYPELAAVLGEFFANWDRLEDWFGPLGAASRAEQFLQYHADQARDLTPLVTADVADAAHSHSMAGYQVLKEIAARDLKGKPLTKVAEAAPGVPVAPSTSGFRIRRWSLLAALTAAALLALALSYPLRHVLLGNLQAERDAAVRLEQAARLDSQKAEADRKDLLREIESARTRQEQTRAALERVVHQEQLGRAELEKQRRHFQQIIEQSDKEKADTIQEVRRQEEAALERLTRENETLSHRLASTEKTPQPLVAQAPVGDRVAQSKDTLDQSGVRHSPEAAAKPAIPSNPKAIAEESKKLAKPSAAQPRSTGAADPILTLPTPPDPTSGQLARSAAADQKFRQAMNHGAASITVLMDPAGEITVQGERLHRTQQHGEKRIFLTPPLEADGDTHFYEIRAAWTGTDGQQRFRSKTIPVLPGGSYTVDLRPEAYP
jgi:hypothetical protein